MKLVSVRTGYLKLFRFIQTHFPILIVLLGIYCIFLISGLHEQYPDEYDSLLGGKRILQGDIPYKDWFQHHQPGAYVLAAFILPVTGLHFLRFRMVLETVYFLIFLGTFMYIKRQFESVIRWFVYVWLLYGLLLSFFWGQMLLADTLSAVLLMPSITVLSLLIWQKKQASRSDIVVIGSSLFLTWFTSMTMIYVIAALTCMTLLLSVPFQNGWKSVRAQLFKTAVLLAIPYIVFFGFYAVIGGLSEWWFANVYYNQNYYIYNYPRPVGTAVNPLRYSVILVDQFIGNFSYALNGVTAFPLTAPLNSGLALFAFAYFYVLLTKKQYMYAVVFLITCIFVSARSNPNNLRNTDYQSSAYILVTLVSGMLALAQIIERIGQKKSITFTHYTDIAVGLLLSVYTVAIFLFSVNEFRGKMLPKYMGTAPLVYDFPQLAPMINDVAGPNDYAWVGPFEFEENFYMRARVPSKYHWFLDHAGKIEKIQKEMISDFLAHPPKVIVFRRDYHPWGGNGREFNGFFTSYLDERYVNTAELNRENTLFVYAWREQNIGSYNLDTEYYFPRNDVESAEQKLIDKGWLTRTAKSD